MTDDHSAAREIIARAIYESHGNPCNGRTWDELDGARFHEYDEADAAIAALTEAGYEIVQRGDEQSGG